MFVIPNSRLVSELRRFLTSQRPWIPCSKLQQLSLLLSCSKEGLIFHASSPSSQVNLSKMVSHHSFKVAHLEITEDATLTGALSRYTDRKKCDFRLRVSGLRVWRSYVAPYCL